MTKSRITVKNQTTVPREVREKLAVGPSDSLQWEMVGNRFLVSAATPAFLNREGRIKVGPGDVVEDVRKARRLMGTRR
jgi:bifunctional DNA-binding transcriptional regulator/antitoxin component of YhaV-PrlF toxin-antitoxin module